MALSRVVSETQWDIIIIIMKMYIVQKYTEKNEI